MKGANMAYITVVSRLFPTHPADVDRGELLVTLQRAVEVLDVRPIGFVTFDARIHVTFPGPWATFHAAVDVQPAALQKIESRVIGPVAFYGDTFTFYCYPDAIHELVPSEAHASIAEILDRWNERAGTSENRYWKDGPGGEWKGEVMLDALPWQIEVDIRRGDHTPEPVARVNLTCKTSLWREVAALFPAPAYMIQLGMVTE